MSSSALGDGAGRRPADGLWRRVLSALTGPDLTDAQREELLALGAAELAWARAQNHQPAAGEVQRIAFEEFSLLLSIRRARTALQERRRAWQ